MVVKVAVIGAGITGLSCATVIQEKFPQVTVTIIAERFSPGTTSDGAAGLWLPYLIGDTPDEEVYEYSKKTWDYLAKLWISPEGGKLGVSLLPCLQASDTPTSLPSYSKFVYGFEVLKPEEIAKFKMPQWKQAYRFITYVCEGSRLMPYLLNKFRLQNGEIRPVKVDRLESLSTEFDIVINCTGIGAKHLMGDELVHPVRGHIFRVKAPWQKSILLDDSETGNYVIPNQDSVVLGGTHDKNDWDLTPRQKDANFILDGCKAHFPALQKAEVMFEWVGLRPGRETLRVETEKLNLKGKDLTIIHNYGHGGSGLTLFYGCALKVADLLQNALESKNTVASKL